VSKRYVIELEPEVRDWLETLRLKDYSASTHDTSAARLVNGHEGDRCPTGV
jgi:hypothetical protein